MNFPHAGSWFVCFFAMSEVTLIALFAIAAIAVIAGIAIIWAGSRSFKQEQNVTQLPTSRTDTDSSRNGDADNDKLPARRDSR